MDPIEKVAVITVTYNPSIGTLRKQLNSCIGCMVHVVVDNGSLKQLVTQMKLLVNDKADFLGLEKNFGIAHAQNVGVMYAIKNYPALEYILFLDHDTVPFNDALEKLAVKAEELKSECMAFGAIGPMLINPKENYYYGFQVSKFGLPLRSRCDSGCKEVDFLNSSGTLVPISSWMEVGKFNTSLFIDHVETDWCLRLKSLGKKVFGCANAVMMHEMGEDMIKFWFLGARSTPRRSPERHYYIFRNSIFLQKQSYTTWGWRVLNIVKLLLTMVFFCIVYKGERRRNFKLMLKGVNDGLHNKVGPIGRK